jgi:hypothetical protein
MPDRSGSADPGDLSNDGRKKGHEQEQKSNGHERESAGHRRPVGCEGDLQRGSRNRETDTHTGGAVAVSEDQSEPKGKEKYGANQGTVSSHAIHLSGSIRGPESTPTRIEISEQKCTGWQESRWAMDFTRDRLCMVCGKMPSLA